MEIIRIHIILAIGLTYLIQIIIHEGGHYLGGTLTGWRLLHLQIFHILLSRKGKGIRISLVPHIACQCVMYPVSISQGALLYTMGGCIMNLIGVVVGLVMMILTGGNLILWLYSWCFTVFGVFLLLLNGRPDTRRICNDKSCFDLIRVDSNTKECHNAQLSIAKPLSEGDTYKDMNRYLVFLCPKLAKNDIQAYQAILEYYYHLDMCNYDKIRSALDKTRDNKSISEEIKRIVQGEYIYSDILMELLSGKGDRKELKENGLNECIQLYRDRGDVHSLRVEAMIEAYLHNIEGDKEGAIDTLNKSIRRIKDMNCMYMGEKVFCISQMDRVLELLMSM